MSPPPPEPYGLVWVSPVAIRLGILGVRVCEWAHGVRRACEHLALWYREAWRCDLDAGRPWGVFKQMEEEGAHLYLLGYRLPQRERTCAVEQEGRDGS